MSQLQKLPGLGQSVWLDNISRNLITSGTLKKLIKEDGIRGVTSNPSIFKNSIAGSDDYLEFIQKILGSDKNIDTKTLYEKLAIRDIQDACDIFEPVYKKTNCLDGYVSLEVSPHLANDTEGTIHEARRLSSTVNRKNLMIKVPATNDGLPAIETILSEGINVNVTLIFDPEAYRKVAQTYVRGVRKFIDAGGNPGALESVASFFVSRIDTAVDKELVAKGAGVDSKLLGKAAIATSCEAYKIFEEEFNRPEWLELVVNGASKQRLLWASTGTKSPKYSDVLYVEELIAVDTVNTLPDKTLKAFREHGSVEKNILANLKTSKNILDKIEAMGISMRAIYDKLLDEGLGSFNAAFDELLGAINKRRG